jgi:DNA-binding transcriptional LysR family regulator
VDRYGELETFVEIAATGSFSAAARARDMTPSAVSRLVKRMEQRLGVRLIDRTTRRLRLTPEGRVLHERAVKILGEMQDAEQAVTSMKGALRGRVRVNASLPIANHRIIPLLPALCQRYPGLKIDLTLTDTLVEMLGEDADVVIRVGRLEDSSVAARRLGSIRRHLVAAPAYLERMGTPSTVEDLDRHECLLFGLHEGLNTWPFKTDEGLVQRRVRGRIRVNNGESMRHLALSGMGIARLGDFFVDDDIRQGRLVKLLDAFNPRDEQPVHALFAGRRNLAARVRAFVDFLAEHLET